MQIIIFSAVFLFLQSAQYAFATVKKLQLPIKIEVSYFTPSRGLTPVITFEAIQDHCFVKINSEQRKEQPSLSCQETIHQLSDKIQKEQMPSEFINPNVDYLNVKINSPEANWERAVKMNRTGFCDTKGKCQDATFPPAWQIADLLRQKFLRKP
jgi:hypothetical protein